jgi:sulfur carrier protein ThiS
MEKMNTIIWHPHPITPTLDRVEYQCTVQPGSNLRKVLLNTGIDPHATIAIQVNDRYIPVAEWDTFCPESGDIVNVCATVQGGGGGGNIIATVLTIAVVVVAVAITAGAAAPLASAMGFSGALVAGSVSAAVAGALFAVAGSMIISAVFTPSVQGFDSSSISSSTSSNANIASSPTYSVSGGSNKIRPYESMPVVFGTHKFFPDGAIKSYTEYRGEDQYLYQIFHFGLSDIEITDYKIGTNPITNYQDYTWKDKNSQGQITQFPGNVDSGTGADLTNAAGWIIRTTSSNTYRIGIDIESLMYYANDAGGLDARSVQIQLQYRPIGGSWSAPTGVEIFGTGTSWDGTYINISGAQNTPLRATIEWPVTKGTYDVRMYRVTADSTNSREKTGTSWSIIKSYQEDSATYIGQNRRGLEIRASEQLNGTIQTLSVMATAKANYYNGSAWVYGATSNPAHWFMDFAIGRYASNGKLLYGIGISQNQLDLTALVAWANFCSTEELTFNCIMDGNQTSADVLNAIGRAGFGSPTWSSGKLGVIWDGRNQSPVAAFGMGNIIKGSFEVNYINDDLAEEIIVRFINPNKDWAQDEVRVLVPGVTTPSRSSSIDLTGCTNQAMAGKFANYMAAQQYYRLRRITWETDFEGFTCQRGDVVILSHDLTQWGYSGRVVSNTGNTITLDREVPRNGSIEYAMLKRPDGRLTTYQVSAASGNQQMLTLTTTPDFQEDFLPIDHMWFFSPVATPGKKVKIISVYPASESRLQIVATDEYPEFYAAWDGSFIQPQVKTMLLNSIPVVANVRQNEVIYVGPDATIRSKVTVSWDATGVWERANVRYRVNGGVWTEISVIDPFFEFDTNRVGALEVSILPIYGSFIGNMITSNFYVYGITRPLSNVTNLLDYFREGKTILTWNRITDPRTIDYEVRKGLEWDKAQVLGRVINNEFITDGDGTYWVAAHTGTLYSPNPTSIVIEGSTLVANVVATYDEEATGWSGTLSGGAAIDGTDIILDGDPIPTEGGYEIPSSHIVDIGTAQACNVSVTYRMLADSPFNLVSLIPVFSAIPSLVGKYAGLADVKIQIAIAPDSGVFAAWRDFVPGTYFGRKFKFRALLYSYDNQVTPILDKMTFTIDMPDRYENGTNVSATAGGISVTYAKPFQIVPNVQVTVINAVANDDIVLSNETESGFDVKIINGATDVTRNINWIAQGY